MDDGGRRGSQRWYHLLSNLTMQWQPEERERESSVHRMDAWSWNDFLYYHYITVFCLLPFSCIFPALYPVNIAHTVFCMPKYIHMYIRYVFMEMQNMPCKFMKYFFLVWFFSFSTFLFSSKVGCVWMACHFVQRWRNSQVSPPTSFPSLRIFSFGAHWIRCRFNKCNQHWDVLNTK